MSQEQKIQEIKEKFENRFSVLQTELGRELDALKQSAESGEANTDLSAFASYINQLKCGYSQTELLNSLLDILANFVPRVMLLIVKDNTLFGWAARGFESDFIEKGIKKVKWPVDDYPELVRAVQEQEFFNASYSDLSDISESISSFDDFSPVKSAFLPVMVRNKVAGMLYVDSGDTMELNQLDVVDILVHIASMELTMVTTKLKQKKKKKVIKAPKLEPVSTVPKVERPREEAEPDFGAPVEEASPVVTEPTPAPAIGLPSHDDASKEEKKAKRVARVLISDLILYNEEKVVEGRRSGGMYNLLKEDIDRSHEHYKSRTDGIVPENPNYFKIELIKQLAEEDESLLGVLPF